jgi:spermidine/putrescine-binding protein
MTGLKANSRSAESLSGAWGVSGTLAAFAAACVAAVAVAVGLTACGARKSPSAPAAEESVLNIYNWADYIGYHTIEEFERQTHIKVVYALYDSNETLETTLLAGSSRYDIVSTTTAFYGRQIKAKAYLPLDKTKLPNWSNLDPAVLAIQAQADPGNRYAVPYLHAMNGFVYNVDMVKARMPDAPTDSSPTAASRSWILRRMSSNSHSRTCTSIRIRRIPKTSRRPNEW